MTKVREWLGAGRARVGESLRRYRRVLTERDPAMLVGAYIVSTFGGWFNTIALISLSAGMAEGAVGVGGMLAVRMLPRLVFQGFAGAVVDRLPGRYLLFVAQMLLAVIAVSFVLLIPFPNLWLLYGLVFLLGTVQTLAQPAFMVQLIGVVSSENRGAANGLMSVGMTIAQFVAPVLGGLVLVSFGLVPVFLVNGLTSLAVAVVVARLRGGLSGGRTRPVAAMAQAEDTAGPTVAAPAGSGPGYGWLIRRLDVVLFGALSMAESLLIFGTITLFIIRADQLGMDERGVGLFYTAVGIGSFFGGILAGSGKHLRRSALYVVAAATVVGVLGLAGFGLADGLALALLALVLHGLMADVGEIAGLTYYQNNLPQSIYGRFYSLFMTMVGLGGVIGSLLGPVIERSVGAGAALTILCLPALVLALALAIVVRVARVVQVEATAHDSQDSVASQRFGAEPGSPSRARTSHN